MKSCKLKIILGEEYSQTTRTMYFDIEKINGFYIGDEEIVDGEKVNPILIFSQGDFIAVMPDPTLERFLLNEFVKPTKKQL